MQLLDQKLGSVGDVHISIVDGKLAIGLEGDLDLIQELDKLKVAHAADFWGSLINVAEVAIKALTAVPVAAPKV